MAVKTTTKIGVQAIKIAPLMGVVMERPLKKSSILAPQPVMAQTTILNRSSLKSIFCLANSKLHRIKTIEANPTRITIKPSGGKYAGITNLLKLKVHA